MDRERELVLRRSIGLGRQKLESVIEKLPDGALVLTDEWLNATLVLEDLESELKNLLDNPPDSEDWSASVCVPVRPPPHLNSGAIALPEPEEPNL
jgi:hypothetical protein